ncbi:MAG: hypothetical protein ABI123_03690 [Ginsengibacter sp.]|jgi:hypothetical protein
MKIKVLLSTLFLFLVCAQFSYSQKQMIGGIDLTVESTGDHWVPGVGATFEYKLTKHSGLETGLFYRTYKVSGYAYSTEFFQNFIIAERHLSIPILYKFYSSIVNFSVGPTIDFYLGWRQKMGKSVIEIDTYNIDPTVGLGAMLKLSKTINLSEKLLLEPELRLNPILGNSRAYGGLGIALKYRLD